MRLRSALAALFGILLITVVLVACCYFAVAGESQRTFDKASEIPHNKVGLVLGSIRYLNGGYENPFFQNRIEAASELYKAGKIDFILVSGDNHRRGYDEASDMKQSLIQHGIPAEKIICDYAGFTTQDSVIRAKEVFQQNSITFISQRFHNERAIYLAKACGIEAIGYNADPVPFKWAWKIYVRELGSRIKAVWDVHVIGLKPKFLGEPIQIGEALDHSTVSELQPH